MVFDTTGYHQMFVLQNL